MKTATPRVVKELVLKVRALAAGALAAHAALGVFSRFEITDVNFLFLLFAHITFLSCVFGLGCVSRAEQLPSPYDLFVWDQVLQTDQLIF